MNAIKVFCSQTINVHRTTKIIPRRRSSYNTQRFPKYPGEWGWCIGVKMTIDLSKLIISPDISQNESTCCLSTLQDEGFVLKQKRASSTKKRWDMGEARLATFRPVIFLLNWRRETLFERTSIHKMKRYEERGSPCRNPTFGVKGCEGSPFTRTE